jgi:hypothetical protein
MKLYPLFRPYLLVLAFVSVFAGPARAELPYAKIKGLYEEGEFEKIRTYLETFLRKADAHTQIKEKIFANKYLGVVYAADPQGAPIAQSYFMQMLELAPTAHISDLYVSNGVERIFLNTKERFLRERRDNAHFDEFGNPRDTTTSGTLPTQPKPAKPHSQGGEGQDQPRPETAKTPKVAAKPRIWPWVVGAGLVAAAAGGYYILSTQPKGRNTVIDGGKPE